MAQLQRPNVLLLITDQQRWDAVGWHTLHGNKVHTPNLETLAAESTVFENAYTQSPQCQPSRTSLLTGKYPTAHRVWWNGCPLDPKHQTLPALLTDHYTAWFGKLDVPRTPQFHELFLTENWCQHYPDAAAEFDSVMTTPHWTGSYTLDRSRHHEDVVTSEATYFLERCHGPWFVGVGFYGPHPPYAAPWPFRDLYDPKTVSLPSGTNRARSVSNGGHPLADSDWAHLIAQYLGQLAWIDDCLGKILSVARNRNDWHNTIVIYTSDHGDILGDHGLFSKGVYAYEGNTKTPLIIKHPDYKPGQHNHLTQLIDILPTVTEWTGYPQQPGTQGKSLTNHITNNTPANNHILSMIGHTPRLRMIRDTTHKYWLIGSNEALYDLTTDPKETTRINDPQKLSEMRLKLAQALIEAEDKEPTP